MKHSKFKSAIFDNRSAIKAKTANLYDNEKLLNNFMTAFDKIDLDKFNKMTPEQQKKLMAEIFGNPESVYGKIINSELKKADKIANERFDTKKKECGWK